MVNSIIKLFRRFFTCSGDDESDLTNSDLNNLNNNLNNNNNNNNRSGNNNNSNNGIRGGNRNSSDDSQQRSGSRSQSVFGALFGCRSSSAAKVKEPYDLTVDEIHDVISITIKKTYSIIVDEDALSIVCEFVVNEWQWKTLKSQYHITNGGLTVKDVTSEASNWHNWAYTNQFPSTGINELRVRIDRKRADRGWLGVGVIRKSFVDKSKKNEGGYSVYSQHCIFIDPTWNAKEPHFNLKHLDVSKQIGMVLGDEIRITVDNEKKEIFFYLNQETEPFAEGNWSKLNYEPLCGYAILTTQHDQFTIVQNQRGYIRKHRTIKNKNLSEEKESQIKDDDQEKNVLQNTSEIDDIANLDFGRIGDV